VELNNIIMKSRIKGFFPFFCGFSLQDCRILLKAYPRTKYLKEVDKVDKDILRYIPEISEAIYAVRIDASLSGLYFFSYD